MMNCYQLLYDGLKEAFKKDQIDFFWRSIDEDIFRLNLDMSIASRMDYIAEIIPRIIKGEPIQYITGYCYFYDRSLKVSPDVLIPRSETELLVNHLISFIKATSSSSSSSSSSQRVLDIGTGSACIAVVTKAHCKNINIQAVELSPKALKVARSNAELHDTYIDFIELDFLDSQSWNRLVDPDVIVSNPPYIAHTEKNIMSPSTLKYEPDMALYALDIDPLIFYKAIHTYAMSLAKYPKIFLEINEFRSSEIIAIFKNKDCKLLNDLEDRPRVVIVK